MAEESAGRTGPSVEDLETYDIAKNSGDHRFLEFIYARMRDIYKEDVNADYMLTLKDFITTFKRLPIVHGRIYDGKVGIQAWAIATRIIPRQSNITAEVQEHRNALAIAAQIGLDWQGASQPSTSADRFRKKLSRIQEILDE